MGSLGAVVVISIHHFTAQRCCILHTESFHLSLWILDGTAAQTAALSSLLTLCQEQQQMDQPEAGQQQHQ